MKPVSNFLRPSRRNEKEIEEDTVVATLVYSDREDRVFCLEENHQGGDRCDLGGDARNKNGDPSCQDAAAAGDTSTGSAHMNPVNMVLNCAHILTKPHLLGELLC